MMHKLDNSSVLGDDWGPLGGCCQWSPIVHVNGFITTVMVDINKSSDLKKKQLEQSEMMSKLSGAKAPELEHANESHANDDASAPGLVRHQTPFQSQADWLVSKGLDWKQFKPRFQVCSSFPLTQTQGVKIRILDSDFYHCYLRSLKASPLSRLKASHQQLSWSSTVTKVASCDKGKRPHPALSFSSSLTSTLALLDSSNCAHHQHHLHFPEATLASCQPTHSWKPPPRKPSRTRTPPLLHSPSCSTTITLPTTSGSLPPSETSRYQHRSF